MKLFYCFALGVSILLVNGAQLQQLSKQKDRVNSIVMSKELAQYNGWFNDILLSETKKERIKEIDITHYTWSRLDKNKIKRDTIQSSIVCLEKIFDQINKNETRNPLDVAYNSTVLKEYKDKKIQKYCMLWEKLQIKPLFLQIAVNYCYDKLPLKLVAEDTSVVDDNERDEKIVPKNKKEWQQLEDKYLITCITVAAEGNNIHRFKSGINLSNCNLRSLEGLDHLLKTVFGTENKRFERINCDNNLLKKIDLPYLITVCPSLREFSFANNPVKEIAEQDLIKLSQAPSFGLHRPMLNLEGNGELCVPLDILSSLSAVRLNLQSRTLLNCTDDQIRAITNDKQRLIKCISSEGVKISFSVGAGLSCGGLPFFFNCTQNCPLLYVVSIPFILFFGALSCAAIEIPLHCKNITPLRYAPHIIEYTDSNEEV